MFCQRAIYQEVVTLGGDYLVVVKGNQPALQSKISQLFEPVTTTQLKGEGWSAPPL